MSNVVAKRIVANIAEYQFKMDNVETKITIWRNVRVSNSHKKNERINRVRRSGYETKQNGGNDITIHRAL